MIIKKLRNIFFNNNYRCLKTSTEDTDIINKKKVEIRLHVTQSISKNHIQNEEYNL